MTLRFYMDENVPRQITTGLRLRGIDTLTVQEDVLTDSPDPQVFARAFGLPVCDRSWLRRVLNSVRSQGSISENKIAYTPSQNPGIYCQTMFWSRD